MKRAVALAVVAWIGALASAVSAAPRRTEAEMREAVPVAWRDVKHLPDGFPADFEPPLAAKIPDGKGGAIDLAAPPSAADLKAIKDEVSKGFGLGWYFLPKEDRYRKGPGLTGDEVLADIRADRFVKDSKHVTFIYGFYTRNVDYYYILYRASGDPYYVDQIVKYAEGVEWFLKNRPQQLLPPERRDKPLPDPLAAIPHEPAAAANFWPHVNAARLLLEEARKGGGGPDDPRVAKAKRFLDTATRYLASQVTAPYREVYENPRPGRRPPKFVEGDTVRMLRKQFDLPPRAAQIVEYTPWNQTFFYYATLAAGACAMKDLQIIEKNRDRQETIDLYARICRAAMDRFQRESDCVIKDGKPYLFHRHTPLRDGANTFTLGHPMFGAEDTAHSQSGAWNLPYLWEAGPEFGCTAAIVAAYGNAMVYTLNDPTAERKGKPWPRAHIDSPWYLAVSGRKDKPAPRLGDRYYAMLAFSPELLAANRTWSRGDITRGELRFLVLHAGTLDRSRKP
jgi:hypothetical protein